MRPRLDGVRALCLASAVLLLCDSPAMEDRHSTLWCHYLNSAGLACSTGAGNLTPVRRAEGSTWCLHTEGMWVSDWGGGGLTGAPVYLWFLNENHWNKELLGTPWLWIQNVHHISGFTFLWGHSDKAAVFVLRTSRDRRCPSASEGIVLYLHLKADLGCGNMQIIWVDFLAEFGFY